MTPKELLIAINLPEDEFHLRWAKDTMDLANVIELDTPKKPEFIHDFTGKWFRCATCNERKVTPVNKYCSECGQRLAWNEE